MIDASFFRDWLGLISLVIALGGTFYAWLTSKSKINEQHLSRVDERLSEYAERLSKLENEIDHLPAKDDVIEMKLALAELKGTIGRLDESLSGAVRTVRRMEDYLLKEKQ